MQPGKSRTGSGHQSKNDLFIALYYPPDQLADELLQYPDWFVSGNAANLMPNFFTATLQLSE
jgi:hypothetical protein